nr:hypothetical protein BaRGS_013277 [Batillaria attramentaria]
MAVQKIEEKRDKRVDWTLRFRQLWQRRRSKIWLAAFVVGVGVQTSQPIATKFAMSLEGHLGMSTWGENLG